MHASAPIEGAVALLTQRLQATSSTVHVPAALYIGLMSGTSMDGIDGVLADLSPSAPRLLLGHVHQAFGVTLRSTLLALNASGQDELHRAALAGNALAVAYADVVTELLARTGMDASSVLAIGAHGQTVRHQPGLHDGIGYTTQLLNGALLSERTGIDVVCDFRSRDVAAGGQGAPLVPAFHRAQFGKQGEDLAVLNIGGIANLTFLHGDGRTSGHDCGPGNVLMDLWCQEHTGASHDIAGQWAASGRPIASLLQILLVEPFLCAPPPKSTGRDLFNRPWLGARLANFLHQQNDWTAADVQATLTLYTARVASQEVKRWMPAAHQVLVCGGGALNDCLMRDLAREMPGTDVCSIETVANINPMQVEATAFAWLAHAFMQRRTGNCIDVTGAKGPRILGALYPA